MVDIKNELDTFLDGKRVYIQVIEGGGTFNEAAAFRMGRYLETSFRDLEVRYLIGFLAENWDLAKDKNKNTPKDIELDINKATLEKLKNLGVTEDKVIKKTDGLSGTQDFIVTCPADGGEQGAIAVEKFLEKMQNAGLINAKYLGFIKLEPFAWKSESRFIRLVGKTYLLNLPKLADYPDLTASTGSSTSSSPTVGSSIIALLGELVKQKYDFMLTYGLHALYEPDNGSNALDEAHFFWIARACAALTMGVADYAAIKGKKYAILLALHPKNQFDEKYLSVTERKIVIYVSRGRQPAIETAPGTIHSIPINCNSLKELIAEIVKAKTP